MSDPANDLATNLAAQFEGFSAKPYPDPTGVPTIGYGSIRVGGTGPARVTMATPPIDEPTARSWMAAELLTCANEIDDVVDVPLTDGQRAALEDFIYNCGVGAFDGSTLLKLLNQGDYDGACAQLARWVHAGGVVLAGLVRRRQADQALWDSDPT